MAVCRFRSRGLVRKTNTERKMTGPSGVILEMVKIGEEPCLSSLTTVFNVLFAGKLPEEWVLSLLLLILKGKGDTSVRIRTRK